MGHPKTFHDLMTDYKGSAHRGDETWNGLNVFVMGANSGKVYVNAGGNLRHDPASLNKLMVFYLARRAINQGLLDLDDTYTVSKQAGDVPYTKLERGDRISLRTALDAMMTNSDNGATSLIAEQISRELGKKSLVGHMNSTADRLGMDHTHYSNTHGLPGNNHSTAKDIATLTRQIFREFPEAANYYMGHDKVKYDGQNWEAHHTLNRPGAEERSEYKVAAKTGYTDKANHNISATITAPDGRKLIVVVMGADWISQKRLDQIGLPMSGRGDVKGNHFRDELVQNIARQVFRPSRNLASLDHVPEATLAEALHHGSKLGAFAQNDDPALLPATLQIKRAATNATTQGPNRV